MDRTGCLFGACVLLVAGAAHAVDVGVSARKLVIIDKTGAGGAAKLVFVSSDKTAGISKGAGIDVADIDVALDLRYGNDATAGTFVVPAGASAAGSSPGWRTNTATVAKYVNGAAPGGPTGAKVVVIKPGKLLKLTGNSAGDTPIDITAAGDPGASGVTAVFTVRNGAETVRHCTAFTAVGGSTITYRTLSGGAGAK